MPRPRSACCARAGCCWSTTRCGAAAWPTRADRSAGTEAIRRVNAMLRDDKRVDFSLIPIGDGVALARKRAPGEG